MSTIHTIEVHIYEEDMISLLEYEAELNRRGKLLDRGGEMTDEQEERTYKLGVRAKEIAVDRLYGLLHGCEEFYLQLKLDEALAARVVPDTDDEEGN